MKCIEYIIDELSGLYILQNTHIVLNISIFTFVLNGLGGAVETNRITTSFPFFLRSIFLSVDTSSLTEVLIRGWADGSLGGRDVENGSRLGALVAFRETASVLIVVY